MEGLKKRPKQTLSRGPHFEVMFGRNGKKRKEFPSKLRVTRLPTSTNRSSISARRFFNNNKQGDDYSVWMLKPNNCVLV